MQPCPSRPRHIGFSIANWDRAAAIHRWCELPLRNRQIRVKLLRDFGDLRISAKVSEESARHSARKLPKVEHFATL
jgi:hypothetical protein